MRILIRHIGNIRRLCEQHRVKALFVFGSIINGKFKPGSDIDMLVDIDAKDPFDYANNYFDLKFKLEQVLKRRVDLLEQKAIKNPFLKKEIDRTKVLVYGK